MGSFAKASNTFSNDFNRIGQGVLSALSFAVLLAGTNLITPLIPLYKTELGFSPLIISFTFVFYVTILIITLFVMSKPYFLKSAPKLLCSSLLCAVLADILISNATENSILIGRMIAGIAGGLGTGSAAALAYASLGSKARAISTTGNLVGAVFGTILCQLAVIRFGQLTMSYAFYVHATLSFLVLIILAFFLFKNRRTNSLILAVNVTKKTTSPFRLSGFNTFYIIGCVSWISLSVAIVYFPTFFNNENMIIASHFSAIIMLILCAIGQIFSPMLTHILPKLSGMVSLLLGIALVIISKLTHSSLLALVALGFVGFGVGVSYKLCLLMLTSGVSPSEHGARSSHFASVTYLSAAIMVLVCGFSGNLIGLNKSVVFVYLTIFIVILFYLSKAPKLKDADTLSAVDNL